MGLRGRGPARCLDRPLGASSRTRRAQAAGRAAGSRQSRRGGDRCNGRAGSRRSRGVFRPLPAAGRPRVDRSTRGARAGGCDRSALGRADAAHAAARPALHVAHRALHRGTHPRALALAAPPFESLPRRRTRPPDAPGVQSRRAASPGAGGRRRALSTHDGRDSSCRLPVGLGARVGRDAGRGSRRRHGRRAARRRRPRAPGGADRARPRPRALPARAAARGPVPCQCGRRGRGRSACWS